MSLAMPPNVPTGDRATCGDHAGISLSGFVEAIIVVPELGTACCKVVELRKMRLISRGVKDALYRSVQGYALKLGSEHGPFPPALTAFFSSCRLQWLQVYVPDISGDHSEINATQPICVHL